MVYNPTLRLALLGGYKPSLGLAQLLGLPAPEVMESSVCSADLHRWLRQSPALLNSSSPTRKKGIHDHFSALSNVCTSAGSFIPQPCVVILWFMVHFPLHQPLLQGTEKLGGDVGNAALGFGSRPGWDEWWSGEERRTLWDVVSQ